MQQVAITTSEEFVLSQELANCKRNKWQKKLLLSGWRFRTSAFLLRTLLLFSG